MNTDLNTKKTKSKLQLSSKRQVAFYITLLTVLVSIGGYWHYGRKKEQIIQQKEKILTAIATLKAKQLEMWYKDEINDAQIISANPYLEEVAKTYVRSNSLIHKTQLLELLQQIKLEHEYAEVFLTSSDGSIIAATNSQATTIYPDELRSLKNVMQHEKAISTGFFNATPNGNKQSLISFISLINGDVNNPGYAIIMRDDAANQILPLLENWPTESQTGESFIFNNETNNIILFNELKHQAEIETKDKIKAKNDDLLSQIYISKQPRIYQGKNYRNVDVLASMQAIEGTDWVLISKVDKSELFQDIKRLAIQTLVAVLFIIVMSGLFIAFLFNTRQKNIYKELLENEMELWAQQEKFKVVMDSIGDGIITLDLNGNIQYLNTRAEKLTGWNLKEALGRDFHEVYNVINEETGLQENNILDKVLKKGLVKELGNHTLLISKSGTKIPVMDTGAPLFDASGKVTGIAISFQDETEKRQQKRLLVESEARYRSTLDSMIEGCQLIGFDYKYLLLNKAAIEQAKLPKEKLLGKTMMECYPGIEKTKMYSVLKRCMEERVPESMDNEFTYPDGRKEYFHLKFEPIPEGIFILSADITEKKLAEEASRESEEKFKNAFEYSAIGMALISLDGKWLKVNFNVCEVLGYSEEELSEKIWQEITHPDDLQTDLNYVAKMVAGEIETYNMEKRYFHKNGNIVWADLFVSLVKDKNGLPLYFISQIKDITDQIRAEEELRIKKQLLSSVMETQQELICRFLPDTTLTFVNKAYCNIFGINEQELIGSKFLGLIPKNEWEDILSILKNLNADNPSHTYVSSSNKPDGSVMSMEWTDTAILNEQNEVVEFQSVGRDITEKLKAEQELIKSKEKAEESDKLKTAFINNISHEVRTPLNAILGFGQILVDMDMAPEKRLKYYEVFQSSSNRLMNTMTDYMDMAMIFSDTIKVRRKVFEPQPLFEEIAENTKQLVAEKKIDFKTEIPSEPTDFFMHSDPEFIRKIMDKLLDNAFKFTQQGKISCGYQIKPGFVEFFVQDTGIGIDSDKLEMIFNMFVQGDTSSTRGYEGSGLGLSIANGLANQLGGSISVTSEKDKGSIFKFKVPINKTEITEKTAPTEEKNVIDAEKPLVLIAEDDESNYLYLEEVLKQAGWDYLWAQNGSEAVELCKQHIDITLVLMDIKMPVMNGLEATKLIHEFRPELPIIATTAYAQIGDEQRFLDAGCNGYIPKPINKKELFKLLQKLI